jgi:hypothetical protein
MSDHDPVVVGLELAATLSDRPLTGQGWFTSPAGSSPAMPEATGKTQFAFDVKYPKDTNVAQGSASFTFAAGGLSFVATSFDWLVANAPVAMIQGDGTVNGTAGYRFRITALDGSPDRLRFQVWTAGGDVVYDNGALQPLGGGSIVLRPPK